MSLTNKFKAIEVSNDIPIWDKFNITEEQYNIVKRIYDLYSESYDIHIEFVDKLDKFIEKNYDYGKYKINDKAEWRRDKYDLSDYSSRLANWYADGSEFKYLRMIMFAVLELTINKWRNKSNKDSLHMKYSDDIDGKFEEKISLEEVLNILNTYGWWL